MGRWYDRYPDLAMCLEGLKEMKKSARDKLIASIIEMVQQYDQALIDESVLDFPLELPRRRWYDKDPYLWLIFNGLRNADKELIHKITEFMLHEMRLKKHFSAPK